MKASEIREKFIKFFKDKDHSVVPSSTIVAKNDPSLMFTNAGMNQFKSIFLGDKSNNTLKRVVNSQKCLRVSGKHNDLEEVGVDHYHHTMFEMLGNWSFGDYFKEEIIKWSYELLTKTYGLNSDDLYVSIFQGDKNDKTSKDDEAFKIWSEIVGHEKIILGNKKDLIEVPKTILNSMEVIPVKNVDEVLKVALTKSLKRVEWVEVDQISKKEKLKKELSTH